MDIKKVLQAALEEVERQTYPSFGVEKEGKGKETLVRNEVSLVAEVSNVNKCLSLYYRPYKGRVGRLFLSVPIYNENDAHEHAAFINEAFRQALNEARNHEHLDGR